MTAARTAGLAAAIALGLCSASAAAETWSMPTPYGVNNFHTENIMQFAKEIEEQTNGELKIEVHPGGSLIKAPEIKNAVRGGQVPMGEVGLATMSNEDPILGVDSLPFLVNSYDQAQKLWEASKPATQAYFDKQNMMILYSVAWPPQGLYTTEEISDITQMAGVKFRAYNPLTARIAELMGAVPTQVELPDVPQAFSTGRVSAMITSPTTGAETKVWDFVSHFHNVQAFFPKNAVFVNKEAFASLSPETQQIVLDAAARAEKRGWEASRGQTEWALGVLRENGMNVHELEGKFATQLSDIGKVLIDEWREQTGEQGVNILAAMGK
jgi:TRAP-type C4-dicarboxylate transport system substrate-binding protein